MKRLTFLIFTIFLTSQAFFAQDNNVFLDRTFWKENPSIEIIEQHIQNGNDVTARNKYAFDPIVYAILEKTDNTTIVHLLQKKGNGVNKLTHDGRTYIFWAAYRNNVEMMEYLVEKGAKTNIIDDHGNTVLTFAASTGQTNPKLYDFLLNHGASISETNKDGANAVLLVTPTLENLEQLAYFLDKGLTLESKDKLGNNVFNYVARTGNTAMLQLLLDKGVTPKVRNKEGANAMFFAARGTRGKTNSLDVYKFLESAGAPAKVSTFDGENPLHILAYREKDLAIFNYFIQKGNAIEIEDPNGNTPLLNAARSNSVEVVQYLLEKGAALNHQNKIGENELMLALQNNTPDVVAFLLDQGTLLETKDAKGNDAIYYLWTSYKNGTLGQWKEKMALLKKENVDLSKSQAGKNTPYHLLVTFDNVEVLKQLEELKITSKVNDKNSDGLSPLHLAAMNTKDDVLLKYLLKIGADKSVTTDFGETPYDLAMENELLRKHQIDLNFLKP